MQRKQPPHPPTKQRERLRHIKAEAFRQGFEKGYDMGLAEGKRQAEQQTTPPHK